MANIRKTITITLPAHRWLEAEAQRLGITVSTLIGRILDEARNK